MEQREFDYLESGINDSFFAIVDLETTGFSPKRGDKIIEIAIITVDLAGNVVDTYETLINPKRYVGATNIHGITAEMVKNAPIFEDVLADILYHLQNKTVVGHNVSFDLRFLNYEIAKHLKNHKEIQGVCTMELSRKIVPELPARRLECLCDYFDIENNFSHSAYGDCLTTLELFNIFRSYLVDEMGINDFISTFFDPITFKNKLEPRNVTFKRGEAFKVKTLESDQFLRIIRRLPANPKDSVPVQEYLNIIDEILADRLITAQETQILSDFLEEFNFSQEQVFEIHKEYLTKLIRVYLLDNNISVSEQLDLDRVCDLLCIDHETAANIIEVEKSTLASQQDTTSNGQEILLVGKSVCFTGQLNSKLNGVMIDRMQAQQFAMERGLIVKGGVSNKLDFLVTSDPYSLSGKARKAHDLGVKIIAEPVFWNIIGIAVE